MTAIGKMTCYSAMKTAFKDGIEYRTMPFKDYFRKKAMSEKPDSELMADIINNIYKGQSLLMMIKTKSYSPAVDWEKLSEKAAEIVNIEKAANTGSAKITDTFSKGLKNPDVCFMAWYDALSEHVSSIANFLADIKAPVPVIQEELQKLVCSLSKNSDFSNAKKAVYEKLKKLYPKTYKKRLQIMEQGYNTQVQNSVNEIVKTIVNCK